MLTRNFYLLLFIFLFMAGCKNPDSAPEVRDFVYQDLKKQEADVKKQIDAKKKELLELHESLADLPDSDYQKKLTRADIFKTENEISKLKQMQNFYKISSESRQIYARKEYLAYFKAGKEKEWPKPETKIIYEQEKKSAAAPKHWTRGIAEKKPDPNDKKAAKKESESKH